MKGLVIWAYVDCRSTTATYRALMKACGVPSRLVMLRGEADCGFDLRMKTGFRADEFSDVEKTYIGMDYARGCTVLDETRGWHQLFCDYQGAEVPRQLIAEAKRRGCLVAVMSESPCNMMSGLRAFLKEVFLRTILSWRVRRVVRDADFFVNYSGNDDSARRLAGWPQEKVIPFGYFPPAIEGSKCEARARRLRPFTILATGILARYRGADVLVDALRLLKERGIEYRATITQEGELLQELKDSASRYQLPIEFPGFLPMPELIKLYETCSVYVGAGRSEPWGMRLNDALNCGAPLVVSRGMGGCKLVDDYGCGLTFASGDSRALADALQRLAQDESLYAGCAAKAALAAKEIQPEVQASRLLVKLRSFGWF